MSVGDNFDDFFYLIYKLVEIDQMHLIVDPIGLPLVQCLHDPSKFLVLSLTIVLDQLHQITVLKVSAHPIFLFAIT